MNQIQKWGNSLGVRIPKAIAIQAGIEEGALVDFQIEGDRIIIRRKQPTLEMLLSQITPENLHKEVSTSDAVGREEW